MIAPLRDRYEDAARQLRSVRVELVDARQRVKRLEDLAHQLNQLALERNLDRHTAYQAYRAACEAENLEPHTFDMWTVHCEPTGPLG